MEANEKKDGQKPEVYKIVTLGQGNVNRREFVKCVAVATGVAVVAMGADDSDAQSTNRGGAAVNLLLLSDDDDPCNIGCQCHMVCACEFVGTCDCDVVSSKCKPVLTGQTEKTDVYNQTQQFDGSVCTCNRVAVCTCNFVCTCESVCGTHCPSNCPCVGNTCSCVGNTCSCVGNTHYWYPC